MSSLIFSSVEFIFIFLPIAFGLYFLIHRLGLHRLALISLFIASLFFYGFWNPDYLFLIGFSIVFNFAFGRLVSKVTSRKSKKVILAFGIAGNLALLGYYKYFDFLAENLNVLFSANIALRELLLPLAISFFTFQQIAYLVDAYRGETKQYNFFTYALFVTFFPQLIAGPIVHHKEIIPQFLDSKKYSMRSENMARGIFIFCIGLAKKVAIADTLSIWANEGYANVESLGPVDAWITTLSYTMQLYFDFSAYGDMAIGIALLFNIKLPINFYSPYKSRNIQEFWRTWHMTLNRFLTQYLYFPLGGSRKGSFRTYVNIAIIFLVSGIWHGAGWTFIIWGALHGLASIICRLWGRAGIRLPYGVSWILTFLFVHLAWVYFRAESVVQAHTMFDAMFSLPDFSYKLFAEGLAFMASWESFKVMEFAPMVSPVFTIAFLGIASLATFVLPNSIQLLERYRPGYLSLAISGTCVGLVMTAAYFVHKNSEFLYFNF
nr:MBOAT family protein [Bhargavaea cecembensis]